jgi:hypothetical protein
MHTISLIYGEQVLDDLAFCRKYDKIIERYSHGIMTLQGSPLETLKATAADPGSVPGWTHLLESHPQDRAVLQEFLTRLIRHYVRIGRLV